MEIGLDSFLWSIALDHVKLILDLYIYKKEQRAAS